MRRQNAQLIRCVTDAMATHILNISFSIVIKLTCFPPRTREIRCARPPAAPGPRLRGNCYPDLVGLKWPRVSHFPQSSAWVSLVEISDTKLDMLISNQYLHSVTYMTTTPKQNFAESGRRTYGLHPIPINFCRTPRQVTSFAKGMLRRRLNLV